MNGEELYVNNMFDYYWDQIQLTAHQASLWRPGLPRPRLCHFVYQAMPRVAT